MKALFLIFHGFNEANGISKKIRYQVKALKDCGVDVRLCHYDVTSYGERRWMVDDEVIADFGTGFAAKIWKRVYYSPIVDYARHEGIDFVYMRSFHNASPFTLRLVKSLKRIGAKVVMEIPTYPYDQEYVTRSMKFHLAIDRCFRHKLAKALDGIVTFSNAEEIFGGNTIRISNGIDFEAIPMKQQQNDTSKELHLIGVAEVHYWHGFDRLVRGLADYYRSNPEYKVYFHIVGPLSGERERAGILPVVRDNHLEPYVLLHGPLHGDELDAMFEKADFAIGTPPQRNYVYQNVEKPRVCRTWLRVHLLGNRRRLRPHAVCMEGGTRRISGGYSRTDRLPEDPENDACRDTRIGLPAIVEDANAESDRRHKDQR